MSAPHGPSGLAGYITMQCLVGLPGCDDRACVCACHSAGDQADDRPRCDEPADQTRFVRCTKRANHYGERHTAELSGGSFTWGYVPTEAESSDEQPSDDLQEEEEQRCHAEE